MKLPNGYGSVTKLSGNRRKPYIVRITTGYDEDGQPIRTVLDSFKSKGDALQALADYNEEPIDLESSKKTFSEIYEEWSAKEYPKIKSDSSIRCFKAAYKECVPLYKVQMFKIRTRKLQAIIDKCGNGFESKKHIKKLFNKMFTYCMEQEYLKKNYAEHVKVEESENRIKKERKPFLTTEIDLLWKAVQAHPENVGVMLVLILIHSGVRISELLDLKKTEVKLDEQWFKVVDSKTAAGIRVVPIADKVLPFWKFFDGLSKCDQFFCTVDGSKRLTYDNFKKRYWYPVMEQLHFDHTPHETRHTCISILTMRNVNKTIIKKIVGHKSQMDLTEKVYTHIEIQSLLDAINTI